MFKKVPSIVVGVLIMVSLLAGCQSNINEGPSVTRVAETVHTPIATVTPNVSIRPSTGKLIIWHFNKDEAPKIEKSFETAFKGVDLEIPLSSDS